MVDTTKTITAQLNTPDAKEASVDQNEQSIEELEKVGQVMAVSSFNRKIANGTSLGADWTSSPILVALKFAGEDMDCRKKTIDIEAPSAEDYDNLTVKITDEGYLDDSIAGGLIILRMEKKEGVWEIKKATQCWKCWKGRGHQDFSSEPCS